MQVYDPIALGRAAWREGDVAAALGHFEAAVAAGNDPAGGRALAGVCLASLGRTEEAIASIFLAIESEPHRPEFYRFLADVDPRALRVRDVPVLEALSGPEHPPHERIDANFALAKHYAALEPARSFQHMTRANAEKRRLCSYDEAATLTAFERIASVFNRQCIENGPKPAEPSDVPIFIFGMPRSGTTLVEQILASHPSVHGAGEISLLEDSVKRELGDGAPLTVAIGSRYVESLREIAPTAKRITDKMPLNFRYAGLIAMLLPNARMIHVRRDPIDTCLSCFLNSFEGESLGWTYDLDELARYYKGYVRLMDHWRAVLPGGRILDVAYEDLIGDLDGQVRRLLAYCGLPWDQRCLTFYETDRTVQTASATQVRRPIYRDSLYRSRSYGAALQPLLDLLEQGE